MSMSIVRSRLSALYLATRRHAAAILLLLGSSGGTVAATPVHVLDVHDAIGPASADYIVRGIAKAHAVASPLVVIRLDTPGGLDTAMRAVVQAILASPVPVVVYVSPEGGRAASAGTYILQAAHIAAMAPATTLGAATPVAIGMPGGERRPPADTRPKDRNAKEDQAHPADAPMAPAEAMNAKQVNDAAAFMRGLAQQRGRNAQWVERAVREAVTLTADEALRENVIDIVARDLPDLLKQVDGRTVQVHAGPVTLATAGLPIEALPPDWRQKLLSVIANPSFALILMMIGVYGLIFEFSSPGFGLPGTVGAICLLLALFALQLLPVNYAGLGLILLGMALLAAEVFTPSFGVLGLGGVAAFIAGGLLLFDRDIPGFGVPLPLILGLAVTSAAVVLAAGGMALRARRQPVVSGSEEMHGIPGQVLAVDDNGAWVQVHGERWRADSQDKLTVGAPVRVTGMRGLTLEVRVDTDTKGDTT